jgi:hypothetical protein
MDGEQLNKLNALITGGYKKTGMKQKEQDFFNNNKGHISATIEDYLANMSASQLAAMKESTFNAMNDALNAMSGEPEGSINSHLTDWLNTYAIPGIKHPSAAALRGSMNTTIAKNLGIDLAPPPRRNP